MRVQGDRVAGGALRRAYEEHQLSLVRLATLLLADQVAAEDLVHDVFLRCRDRLEDLDDRETHAYLRRSVLNAWKNRRRHLGVEARSMPKLATPSAADPAAVIDERRGLWGAIERLPDRQRAVIVLRYYEDLPDLEIARLLGCADGALAGQARPGQAPRGGGPMSIEDRVRAALRDRAQRVRVARTRWDEIEQASPAESGLPRASGPRRALAAAVALAVFAAAGLLLWSAFRPSDGVTPAGAGTVTPAGAGTDPLFRDCIEGAGYDWEEVYPPWNSPEPPPKDSVFADRAFWQAWEVCLVETGLVEPFDEERIAAENREVMKYVRCMRERGWNLPDPWPWEGPYHPGLLTPADFDVPKDPFTSAGRNTALVGERSTASLTASSTASRTVRSANPAELVADCDQDEVPPADGAARDPRPARPCSVRRRVRSGGRWARSAAKASRSSRRPTASVGERGRTGVEAKPDRLNLLLPPRRSRSPSDRT